MNGKRTTNRATRLFTALGVILLLALADAPVAHAGGAWTEQVPALPSPRTAPMASLGGDQVLLFGGFKSGGYPLSGDT